MPVAARLAPAPAVARSNTATERPRNASRHAIDKPMTPAPTTATSTAAGISMSGADEEDNEADDENDEDARRWLYPPALAGEGKSLLPINLVAGKSACIK